MNLITANLKIIATIFGIIGCLWGAWVVFNKANAWAADMQRMETSAKQSRQQLINEANTLILDVQLTTQKLEVHRLRKTEKEREAIGSELTISEKEELETAVIKRDLLQKTVLRLNKIKALEVQMEEAASQ